MPRAVATPQVVFDLVLEGLLIALLLFTPFAFGTVHMWAISLMESALVLMFALWLIRQVWSRPASRPARTAGPDDGTVSLAGYRFIRTGLALPIGLFLALVALQLAPLPPAVTRHLSPAAAELFERGLPGWKEGRVDFTRLEPWLTGEDSGSITRMLAAPEASPLDLPVQAGAARPVSIYPHETLSRFLILAALLMAFLVALHTLRERPRIERFCWVAVLVGLGLSVMGLVQRLDWNGRIYGFYPVPEGASPFGPFLNHNHFAAWLEMALPLSLGLLLRWLSHAAAVGEGSAEQEWDESPGDAWWRPARLARQGPDVLARIGLSGFASVVMLAALLLSGSRGAVLALALAFVLHGGLMWARGELGRREAVAGAAVLAASLALVVWVAPSHVGEMGRKLERVVDYDSEPSLAARVVGWRSSLGIARDYPLLGSGLGTFADAWLRVYPPGTANVWKEAHNDYLQILVETGGAGLILLAWGLALFVARHLIPRRSPGAPRSAKDTALRHGMVVGLLAILFHSTVDFSLQVCAIALLFVVLAAALIAENRLQAALPPPDAP